MLVRGVWRRPLGFFGFFDFVFCLIFVIFLFLVVSILRVGFSFLSFI